MHIRPANSADADAVRQVIQQEYVEGGFADPVQDAAYVQQLLDVESRIDTDVVFVAEIDGRIVGTVTALTPGSSYSNLAQPGEIEIRMLGVMTPARGRGVGRALVRACEDLGREAGASTAVLCTDPRMTAARALYEGLGYLRCPPRDWDAGGITLAAYTRSLP